MATTNIGERLKSEREKRKLGLRDLGKMIDCPPTHISRIESGEAIPKEEILRKYSIVFEIPLEELLALIDKSCRKEEALGNRRLLRKNQDLFEYLAEHQELLDKNIKFGEKTFAYILLKTPRNMARWFDRSCTIQISYPKNGDNPAFDMILDQVDGMFLLKSFNHPKFNYRINPIQKDVETVEIWMF